MPVFNFGSGGTGLSIKVNAYSSFPTTASENTVGILSGTAVSKYYFGTTAPTTGLADGMVWIRTGSSSTTPIPVNTKNNVYLYPVAAKQYLNGAWADIDASSVKCYQAGSWHVWEKRIYTSVDGTGTQNVPLEANDTAAVDDANGYIRVGKTASTGSSGVVKTVNTLAMGDYRKLKIDYEVDSSDTLGGIVFGLTDNNGGYWDFQVSAAATSKSRITAELDISAAVAQSPELYIRFVSKYATSSKVKLTRIYNVWLEG